jgi:hypothetical protein
MSLFKILLSIVMAMVLSSCGGGGGCASSEGCESSGDFVANPSSAVSVTIGAGDKIETTAQDIKYKERYAITVVDTLGRPVAGAVVNVQNTMLSFYKGYYARDESNELIAKGVYDPVTEMMSGPVQECASEDLNNNDIKDANEDTNGDGVLTPAKAEVVVSPETTNITDSQGIVYVIVEYSKRQATWLQYKLTASATVTGTEGKISRNFFT